MRYIDNFHAYIMHINTEIVWYSDSKELDSIKNEKVYMTYDFNQVNKTSSNAFYWNIIPKPKLLFAMENNRFVGPIRINLIPLSVCLLKSMLVHVNFILVRPTTGIWKYILYIKILSKKLATD